MAFRTEGPALAARGFRVVPVLPRTKRPKFAQWLQIATDDPETVARWARSYGHYGVGLVPREQLVVDVDDPDLFREYLAERDVTLPATFTVQTARGRHLWFSLPGELDVPNARVKGGDLKIKGMLVGPGSVHPSGIEYALVDDRDPVPAPEWLVLAMVENANRRQAVRPTGAGRSTADGIEAKRSDPRRVVGRVHAATEGTRNDLTFWAMCRACDERDEAYVQLVREAAEDVGLGEDEIDNIERNARRSTGWSR